MSTGNTLADIALKGGLAQGLANMPGMGKGITDSIAGGLNTGVQYKMYEPAADRPTNRTPRQLD